MDIFIVRSDYRRIEIVDDYVAFMWSERYSAAGDFQLDLAAESESRAFFQVGTRITIAKSYHVMEVVTIEDMIDEEGRSIVRITGESLEAIFEDRVNQWFTAGIPPEKVLLSGRPHSIVDTLVVQACRINSINTRDNIPYLVEGAYLPKGDIPLPPQSVKHEVDHESLYATVKSICDLYNMGFRLIRNDQTARLHFEVYMGSDRTTRQTKNAPVIFGADLDNLTNTTEYTSMAGYKNVAYVKSDLNSRVVYADTIPETITGYARRVLFVDAGKVDLPLGAERDAFLEQKGKEELAKHRPVIAFDGEIPQTGSYEYQKDYVLGDLVEMRGSDGLTTTMRVTEQIFVSDAEGDRSYPTLTIDIVITPGSWYAWDGSMIWNDAEGTWSEV